MESTTLAGDHQPVATVAAITEQLMQDPVKGKLLGMLAAGVSQTSAALAVGVSDSYLSQLVIEQDFASALAALRSKKLDSALHHDEKIETLEEKTLKVLEAKLPFVRSAMDAARIFTMLNAAKKRAAPETSAAAENLGIQQVNIVLPKAAKVLIAMDSSNQVIEVQGKSMATLPSKFLPALAEVVEEKKKKLAEADADEASRRLEQLAPVEGYKLQKPRELVTRIDGVMKVI